MNKTLLYLISGKAGVGKSFAANTIISLYKDKNYNCIIAPFAQGVKQTAKFMGWDGKKDLAGRSLLQSIGQIGRKYNEDVWVSSTIDRIYNSPVYPYDVVVVDDWRFPNEFEYLKNHPLFKVIAFRVVSPDRELLKNNPDQYNEISEVALDSFEYFNYVIDNPITDNNYIVTCLSDIVIAETLKNRS